jgi:hypothetical protein
MPVKVVILREIDADASAIDLIFTLKDGKNYKRLDLSLIPARW